MNGDSSFLGDIGKIFTSGFESALDLEYTKRLNQISNPQRPAETQILRGEDTTARVGQVAPSAGAGGVPVVLLVLAGAALVFVLLNR